MNLIEIKKYLDPIEDALLIGLLDAKIELNIDNINTPVITQKDFQRYKQEAFRTILSGIETLKRDKIKAMYDRVHNCQSCKYSKIKQEEFNSGYQGVMLIEYHAPTDCDVCRSCERRADMLAEKIDLIDEENNEIATSIVNTEEITDIIKCKILLNKLQTKIKNTQHEASKH